MPKKKEKSSEEYYRGIIRSMKSEIRNLKKKIKQLERKEHFHESTNYEDPDDKFQLPLFEEPALEYCPDCSKGILEEVLVVGRYFKRCTQCDFRTKTIKI